MKAPKGKAARPDELFTEASSCDPENVARSRSKIWKRCNDFKTLIPWRRAASLAPIYKKRPKDDPRSYMPIAFLSNARKIVEVAITSLMNQTCRNSENQLGSQKIMGTEMAMSRHIVASKTLEHTAVLNLTGAYDRFPRNTLMYEASKKLPPNTKATISAMVSLITATTEGNNTHTRGIIKRGVPQGLRLSPSLLDSATTPAQSLYGNLHGTP